MLGTILKGITGIASAYFENRSKLKQAEIDAQVRALSAEGEYDVQAQRNMQFTWKDEFIIGVHLFPIYGYIIPSDTLTTQLNLLWFKLGQAPTWWWVIYIGIVTSTFGLRFMHKTMLAAKGIKKV